MKKPSLLFKPILLLVLIVSSTFSIPFHLDQAVAAVPTQSAPDRPDQGEEFQSFFARITRGGGFPGIYLTPPAPIQAAFLRKIQRGYWVGLRNQILKSLAQQNVDVWNHWYKDEQTFAFVLNTPEKQASFQLALTAQIQKDAADCSSACPQAKQIMSSAWKQLDTFSRQEFTKTFVLSWPAFGGRTLLEHLSLLYRYPVEDVLSSTVIRILNHENFVAEVKKLGYDGEVYFRGITAPNPSNPLGHIILLDEELLFRYSPFESPLLKTLEMTGILTHELSHVFQDLKGRALGADVQVRSAEAALILEGSAEYLAEEAMTAAAKLEPGPSALGLFATEQAVEIVYREGNESSGRLFPYTVGLPLAAALYDFAGPDKHDRLTEGILQYLGRPQALQEWLNQLVKF